MSKDLKDLIEKAEEEQASRAILEKTIEGLRTEVASLKKKLEDKKATFHIEPVKRVEERADTEEISILTETIDSLKGKLDQKEQENKTLLEQMGTLRTEFEKVRDEMFNSVKDEMIIKTQNSLNSLIQDYSKLESENKKLKSQISKLQQDIDESTRSNAKLQTEKFQKEQMEKELKDLKSKLLELESNNQSLLRNIKNLQAQGESKNIEQMLEKLEFNKIKLENENKDLINKLESLKREKLKVQRYESEIKELKNKIQELKEYNKNLKDKDSILLAKTITAMSTHDRSQRQPKVSHKKRSEKPKEIIAKKLSLVEEHAIENVTIPKKEVITEKPEIKQIIQQSEEIEKVSSETDNGSIARKWQCPQCGNTNKAQIREIDDKNRPIYAGFYAKKYVCGQCGKEWI